MFDGLHHVAIICSSEKTVEFYRALGFAVESRKERPECHDVLVWMRGYGIALEVYVDATHPPRLSDPEAMGLRHFALHACDFDKTLKTLAHLSPTAVRQTPRGRIAFIRDPDGLPIEIHE